MRRWPVTEWADGPPPLVTNVPVVGEDCLWVCAAASTQGGGKEGAAVRQQRRTRWYGRLARRWWPDRNPVRRRWDRIEAAVVAALIIAFLAGAPVAAMAADGWAHGVARRVQQSELAAWHKVPAVLLARAPRANYPGYAGESLSAVRARWTAPDGTHRSGRVLASPGAKAGSRVMVWVDSAGLQTGPPLADHQVMEQAVLAAMVSVTVLSLALAGAGVGIRRLLDARRMAAWEADWRVTGPRWTTRR